MKRLQLTSKHIHSCWVETAGMSVTLASDQQLCPICLSSDQWASKHSCTRPSGMHVAAAPDNQPCLYKLHNISMHTCYSYILSASVYAALDQQIGLLQFRWSCLKQLYQIIATSVSVVLIRRHVINTCIYKQRSCLLNTYKYACLVHLQGTSIHICYSNVQTYVLYVALASNQQACFYSFTQPAVMS